MPQIPPQPSALGLDLGQARIGVAASRCGIVTPLESVPATQRPKAIARLVQLVCDRHVTLIVVGWPLNMDGTTGRATAKVERLVAELERALLARGLDPMPTIVLWDERLTTVAAQAHLIDSGMRRQRRKQVVDQLAAMHILSSYLDSLTPPPEEE